LCGFEDFKIGGQIIHTVKYADDLVLLAKEEKVLQYMIDKITEKNWKTLRNGNERGKNKSDENFKTTIPSKNYRPKQLENVGSFKYLGSVLTNDGRCTCEIKCRIAMAKAAFKNKRALFTSTWT